MRRSQLMRLEDVEQKLVARQALQRLQVLFSDKEGYRPTLPYVLSILPQLLEVFDTFQSLSPAFRPSITTVLQQLPSRLREQVAARIEVIYRAQASEDEF